MMMRWNDIGMELRQAARRLWRSRGFSAVVVCTLAVGIGGATTIFSVVHSTLLRPLPYPAPEQLVRVFETNRELGIERTGMASGNLLDYRRRMKSFSALAGWYVTGRTLLVENEAQVLRCAMVTEDFFRTLGIEPVAGHTFTPEETARAVYNGAAAPVGTDVGAVISYGLWQTRFGGDAAAIGRTVQIDRRAHRILGVMPQSFAFPNSDVDVWLAWGFATEPPRDQRYVRVLGRIRGDATAAQAEGELQSLAAQFGEQYPASNKGWSAVVQPLHEEITGGTGATLWLLFGAVCCVLLIACANVAHLQWIRASQMRHETAVRVALGASASRLLRQFGTESALLAGAGGILGTALAFAAVQWLRAAAPAQLPRVSEVAVQPAALLFALAMCGVAALAAGIAPAMGARREEMAESLRESARGGAASRGANRVCNALVVAEIAVAALLLVMAGLLGRSWMRLMAVNPGFDAEHVLVAPIFLDNSYYKSGDPVRGYYARLFEKLSALPGVVAVGGATALPASPLGPDFERPVWPEGSGMRASEAPRADVRMVTPDYFRTLQIPVLRGRTFGSQDTPESPRVVMVNEALARLLWPGQEVVGKQIVLDYSTAGTYAHEIVGVVGNVRFYGLRSEPQPEIFIPHAQRSYLIMNVAVRTSGDARALIPAVRRAVLEVDPAQPPQSIRALTDLLGETAAQERLAAWLFGAFSGTALFLAMLGIYGVIAYRTAQRTSEIGVRMALGADARSVMRMVLGAGVAMAAIGAMAGLGLAAAGARMLGKMLFEVSPLDLAAYAAAGGAIVLASACACWLPARRAARVNPVEALRHS